MATLKTKTRSFETDVCLFGGDELYIRLPNVPLNEVFQTFSDPSEISQITYCDEEYLGYTVIKSITNETDAWSLTLKK